MTRQPLGDRALSDLDTPVAIVDLDVVSRNIDRMQRYCVSRRAPITTSHQDSQVSLYRPHAASSRRDRSYVPETL